MTSSSMTAVFTSLRRSAQASTTVREEKIVSGFYWSCQVASDIAHLGIVWIIKMSWPRTDSFTSTRVSENGLGIT